jgi:very-short-patch-repair endonuclease
MLFKTESPIEEILLELMIKERIGELAHIKPQYPIGIYRVDFLLDPKHGKNAGVVVECDGFYHEEPAQK